MCVCGGGGLREETRSPVDRDGSNALALCNWAQTPGNLRTNHHKQPTRLSQIRQPHRPPPIKYFLALLWHLPYKTLPLAPVCGERSSPLLGGRCPVWIEVCLNKVEILNVPQFTLLPAGSARDALLFKKCGDKASWVLPSLSVPLGHCPVPAQSLGLSRGAEVGCTGMRSQTFHKPIKLLRGHNFLFSLAEKIALQVAVWLPWIFLSFSLTERS